MTHLWILEPNVTARRSIRLPDSLRAPPSSVFASRRAAQCRGLKFATMYRSMYRSMYRGRSFDAPGEICPTTGAILVDHGLVARSHTRREDRWSPIAARRDETRRIDRSFDRGLLDRQRRPDRR